MLNSARKYYYNYLIKNAIKGRDLSLLYHYIGNDFDRPSKFHAVTTESFILQIKKLKENWIFVDENIFFDQTKLSKPKILLTFDDNYKSTIHTVAPILEEEKIPYIYFVNQNSIEGKILWRDKIRYIIDNKLVDLFISLNKLPYTSQTFYDDTKNSKLTNSKHMSFLLDDFFIQNNIDLNNCLYATKDDILEYANYKMLKIGNHSSNHYNLASITKDEQKIEILEGHNFIVNNFNRENISGYFSTPFGNFQSFNEDTIDILKQSEYKGMLISMPGYYYNKNTNLTLERNDIVGYKRLLPKEYYKF